MEIVFLFGFIILLIVCLSLVRGQLQKLFLLVIGLLWAGLIGFSLTNPFDLYRVSTLSFFYIVVGFSMIMIGYISYNPKQNNSIIGQTDISKNIERVCNNKRIRFIFLGSLGAIAYLAISQWQLIILQAGLGNLKLDFFELVFNNNHILFFVYQVLLSPLFFLCCVLLAYQILEKKWNLKTLFLGLYVFLFCFIGGKRGYFSIVFIFFFFNYLIFRFSRFNKRTRKKLPVKAFVAIGLIVGLGASLMTAVGSGGTEANKDDINDAIQNLKENIFVYNIGSFRAFDRTVSTDFVNANGGYLYGRATLGGAIDYYGTSILNSMGISLKSARATAMVPIQDNSVTIGKDGRGWNFAYTGFYYFWFDGGFICLVLFSFLFGFFIRYTVELFEHTGTIGSMALVCYMFHACQMMAGTWVNIELYTQPVIFIFYLLHKMELKQRKYEIYKKV